MRKNPYMYGSPAPEEFSDPGELWALALEYFEDADARPVNVREVIRSGPLAGSYMDTPVQRPYTLAGLKVYAATVRGIPPSRLDQYLKQGGQFYERFADVAALIDAHMFEQKFSGAAVGVYNANLIAREIGLAENVDTTTAGAALPPGAVTVISLGAGQAPPEDNEMQSDE